MFLTPLVMTLLAGCSATSENPSADKVTTVQEAIGSYSHDKVDKNEWGDFQLVLRLEKKEFTVGEPIRAKVLFRNIGKKTIVLDGILPMRNIANPPALALEQTQPERHRIRAYGAGIPKELENENPITIEAGKSCILIDTDLLELQSGGHFFRGLSVDSRSVTSLRSSLVEGSYRIWATFDPSPPVYWSRTDKMEFVIRKK